MIWETVVGLEVHVQLGTRSKLFCGCSAAFGSDPNTNVCPVCLGLPGALPVANREAVRLALRAALALDFTVHPVSIFARKNYFYPDLPKGYQISQFDRPLATNGRLRIQSQFRGDVDIRITRLHLEEDAGKSLHDRIPDRTALDFNRSGVPLAEIVSEPDLRSPGEARAYLVVLKQVLRYLGVSDCNMEEGHLRVDANLSVRPADETSLGVKQEVKNMNSFAAVERALTDLHELQVRTLESGRAIERDTYTAATGELQVMRTKEASHDYRYFPEPDLPPLVVTQGGIRDEREMLPELPPARRARLQAQYGVRPYDADVLTSTRELADYFEAVAAEGADPKVAANWIMGPVLQDAHEHEGTLRVEPPQLAALLGLVADGTVSTQAAKRLLPALATSSEPAEEVAARLGLVQVSDEEQLAAWVDVVIDAHDGEVERFRHGEAKLMGFFMGEVMKQSKGKADPKKSQAILRQRLG